MLQNGKIMITMFFAVHGLPLRPNYAIQGAVVMLSHG
jgi:hypothetical protein